VIVAYTLRTSGHVETIRLISARRASRKERTAYGRSDDQLRAMRRVGRPPLGTEARRLIAIRLDPDVLKRLRTEARRRNLGYQTLIHRVLADYVNGHAAS